MINDVKCPKCGGALLIKENAVETSYLLSLGDGGKREVGDFIETDYGDVVKIYCQACNAEWRDAVVLHNEIAAKEAEADNTPKSTFTPGPWRSYAPLNGSTHSKYIVGNKKDNIIAEVRGFGVGVVEDGETAPWHSMEANARLIAAAPCLLASLEELSEWMRSNVAVNDGPEVHNMLVKAANLIIEAGGEIR
jgi:hypothetical protein